MPSWNDILLEVKDQSNVYDHVRRKYIDLLYKATGRNVIIYYSGWLQKPNKGFLDISDDDKLGFMSTIKDLEKKKGLDLILHTPGGNVAAAESIVDYLKIMFDGNIRVIVPQMAMSAGTMIACCAEEIIMGKPSSLGPIDPHIQGISTVAILKEFEKAYKECSVDQKKLPIWNMIISRYPPAFIIECEKAIELSKLLASKWLKESMFKEMKESERDVLVDKIVEKLVNKDENKIHARHFSAEVCKEIGLKIKYMEELKGNNGEDLQDLILSIHHSSIITLTSTSALKIIENQLGKAFIKLDAPSE